MALKSPSVRPPTGWIYVQPETGFEMTAGTLEQLVNVVIQHRIGNGLTPTDRPTVRRQIEEYICGLLRGQKALWDFCETRLQKPAPVRRRAALPGSNLLSRAVPAGSLMSVAALKSHASKSCPTCDG